MSNYEPAEMMKHPPMSIEDWVGMDPKDRPAALWALADACEAAGWDHSEQAESEHCEGERDDKGKLTARQREEVRKHRKMARMFYSLEAMLRDDAEEWDKTVGAAQRAEPTTSSRDEPGENKEPSGQ